jgi:hypothetical protein
LERKKERRKMKMKEEVEVGLAKGVDQGQGLC